MTETTVMRTLIRKLIHKGVEKELVLAVVANLETEENYLEMLKELSKVEHPSRTWLLTKSILIAEPEE